MRVSLVQVHAYRFDNDTSTLIVECTEDTWKALGIDKMTKAESNRFIEELFADYLEGYVDWDWLADEQAIAEQGPVRHTARRENGR